MEYSTNTGSRFIFDRGADICKKVYSNGKEITFTGYALIPVSKEQEVIAEYQGIAKKKRKHLTPLLNRLRKESYEGEGIMLYLYSNSEGYSIRKQKVFLPSNKKDNPGYAVSLDELGINAE